MKKKTKIALWIVLALVAVLLLCCVKCHKADKPTEEIGDTTMVLVQQVKKCARLYTAEVDVHKIVTHDDTKKLETKLLNTRLSLDLPFSDRKIAIPIDAKVKAYIDFDDFSEKNLIRDGDKIEVILPDPQFVLTHTKVRNEDIKKSVALLRSNFSDEELTKYEAQGREEIIAAIPKMKITDAAEEGAAKVLIPILEGLGYADKNITISFRKDFSDVELKRMIVND